MLLGLGCGLRRHHRGLLGSQAGGIFLTGRVTDDLLCCPAMGWINRFLIAAGVACAGVTAYGALTANGVYSDVMKNQSRHQFDPA